MQFLRILILLLTPALAQAAYQDPTISSYERESNGTGKLLLRFTGNAGEPVVTRAYSVTSSSTLAGLRNWVDMTISELNLTHAAASLPALQPGQTILRLTPIAPSPTAKSVWRSKTQIFGQVCGNGFIGAVATACLALKTDIESTYQAGFLDAN